MNPCERRYYIMISSAYQYYLTTYGKPTVSRYDTHKKSDLRKVYNNMLRINKKSPLYKINLTDNVQKFAIDLKENARLFKNTLLETAGSEEGDAFEEKKAYSSDESILEAVYTNPSELDEDDTTYDIEVKQLATPQINTGDFVASNQLDLKPGLYSFDLGISDTTYEFRFKVNDSSTNLEIQEKLARLINRSNVGIKADIIKDNNGSSAIRIAADQTGFPEYRGYAFRITDDNASEESGSVELFGLNKISHPATNALVTINGIDTSSNSNSFVLANSYNITLKDTLPEGKTVQVGLKRSADTIYQNMSMLAERFNSLLDLSTKNSNQDIASNKLKRDLSYITGRYRDILDSSGLTVQEDGHLKPDEALVIQAAQDGSLENNAEEIQKFRDSLIRQIDRISIDPINYINKKMIAYPNPVRSLTNPYRTSIYSGMIFNGYV